MRYATRNSIILAVMTALILLLSMVMFLKGKRDEAEMRKTVMHRQKTLDSLLTRNSVVVDDREFREKLRLLQELFKQKGKDFWAEEDARITYAYLDLIRGRYCPQLMFDFKPEKSEMNHGFNADRYTLSGRSPIRSLYDFIYQIENQMPMYSVQALSVTSDNPNKTASDSVGFSMTLQTFEYKSGIRPDSLKLFGLKEIWLPDNPFREKVYEPRQVEEEEKLLNIDTARIQLITPGMIVMYDQEKRSHILKPGDRVAYGRLESINATKGYAVFALNQTGIIKRKVIHMDKDGL